MRRGPLLLAVAAAAAAVAVAGGPGCGGPAVESIGRAGTGDGEFRDPRGIAVSEHGLAVLDRTGRMQLFDLDGRWRSTVAVVPGDVRRGLPTGAAWLPDGTIAVAHTHESRVVVLSAEGVVLRSFGGYGIEPGRFLYPQRISLDAAGDLVVSEYGFDRTNRVQVLRPDGSVVRTVGGGADEDGGLGRPMGAVSLSDGRLVVADRKAGVVVFDAAGRCAGRFGPPLPDGALPYGVCRGGDGDLYVVDGARGRVFRYAEDGTLRGAFGALGAPPDGFREPWDVAWFAGRLYVADMGNQRVARFDPDAVEWSRP